MILRQRLARIFTILLVAVALPACDSFIDISPDDDIPRDEAFDSPAAAESVLRSAYSGLQEDGAYGGVAVMAADFSTDNADFSGSFTTYQAIQSFNMLANSGPASTIWSDNYTVINATNEVITRVDDVPEISPDFAALLKAEAKFVRALAYHNLVRWYAQPYEPGSNNTQPGVPLVLVPTASGDQDLAVARSSVEEVYAQINSDLDDAVATFTDEGFITHSEDGRAGLGAAWAMQARVKLYQGEYEDAVDAATNVIDSGEYNLALSVNITDIYSTGDTNEDILAIQNSANDNSGTNSFPSSFYMPSALGGRGDITVGEELLALYDDDNDLRQRELIYAVDANGNRAFGVSDAICESDCWTYKYRSASFEDNIRVFRLAEMYLIRAEANARLNNDDDALDDLNVIRERAGLDAYDSVGDIGGDLVDEVILERRRELAFEGDYRHDLIRRGEPLTSGGAPAPEEQRIFPIPQVEIDANGAISESDQNPGY